METKPMEPKPLHRESAQLGSRPLHRCGAGLPAASRGCAEGVLPAVGLQLAERRGRLVRFTQCCGVWVRSLFVLDGKERLRMDFWGDESRIYLKRSVLLL